MVGRSSFNCYLLGGAPMIQQKLIKIMVWISNYIHNFALDVIT